MTFDFCAHSGSWAFEHYKRHPKQQRDACEEVMRAADEDVKRLETLASELRESVARFRL